MNERASDPFRILSLDGGGLRGIFSAAFCAELERLAECRLGDFFDLIVGTSTGAIIAFAVAFRIPAATVLSLFQQQGKIIFPPTYRRGILRPKYSNAALALALKQTFGDRKLNDSETPICVCSYETTSSQPRIWKDDHAVGLNLGGERFARDVALASAAAPIYLPSKQVLVGDNHVDGGLFANNPSLIGITEALKYFRAPITEIAMLSVGTGERAERIGNSSGEKMGLLQWGTKLFDHFAIAQSRSANEISKALLGEGNYFRINMQLESPYRLDDYRSAEVLAEPGAQLARIEYSKLASFFSTPAKRGIRHRDSIRASGLGRP